MEKDLDKVVKDKPTTEANEKKSKIDNYVIGIYITLCILAVIESFSASAREIAATGSVYKPILKHLIFLSGGTLLMYYFAKKEYTWFIRFGWYFVAATAVALLGAMFFGGNVNDASRSLNILGFTIQPAEMAKLAIVFALATILSSWIKQKGRSQLEIWVSVMIVGVFSILLIMQGLTNTMLFMAISLVMYIVAGASFKLCVKVLIVYSVIAGSIYGISEVIAAHRLEELSKNEVVAESAQEEKGKESQLRTDTWASRFNSYFKEVLDTCPSKNESILSSQQKTYSYMAQANGGWYGVGLGQSRETSRLPLAFSDYVYSIVIEESGFIGGTLLLALFFSLMMRAAYIARRCKQAYPALLVMGMAAMIVLQAFSHIAINTGIVPVSGQNLPLISKGGTSVLVICMAFGVIMSVSRTASTSTQKSKAEEKLPEMLKAANPTTDK